MKLYHYSGMKNGAQGVLRDVHSFWLATVGAAAVAATCFTTQNTLAIEQLDNASQPKNRGNGEAAHPKKLFATNLFLHK